MVVHLYGHPAPMEAIVEQAHKHGAESVGGLRPSARRRIAGRLVGTFGDAAAFSFYPTRIWALW